MGASENYQDSSELESLRREINKAFDKAIDYAHNPIYRGGNREDHLRWRIEALSKIAEGLQLFDMATLLLHVANREDKERHSFFECMEDYVELSDKDALIEAARTLAFRKYVRHHKPGGLTLSQVSRYLGITKEQAEEISVGYSAGWNSIRYSGEDIVKYEDEVLRGEAYTWSRRYEMWLEIKARFAELLDEREMKRRTKREEAEKEKSFIMLINLFMDLGNEPKSFRVTKKGDGNGDKDNGDNNPEGLPVQPRGVGAAGKRSRRSAGWN